jgi:hypothetical protein
VASTTNWQPKLPLAYRTVHSVEPEVVDPLKLCVLLFAMEAGAEIEPLVQLAELREIVEPNVFVTLNVAVCAYAALTPPIPMIPARTARLKYFDVNFCTVIVVVSLVCSRRPMRLSAWLRFSRSAESWPTMQVFALSRRNGMTAFQ